MRGRHAILLVGGCLLGCTGPSDTETTLESTRSAIVGGELSNASEDFVVFITHPGPDTFACGGTLVAPNLVLTAKHCINQYVDGSDSLCDGTGEPQVGATGGFTTGTYDVSTIKIFTGVDGRNNARLGAPSAATATRILDDGTQTLCSHDLSYVLLDRPITNVPIGRLRLGKRPEPTDIVTLAGWGLLEQATRTDNRFHRSGMEVLRVGPAIPPADPTGSLGPRTFETGPGGCRGDSGSPAFDPATNAVTGVLARALNLDPSNAISPCAPATVSNVFMLVMDFDDLLRKAFTAANAEPWIEGRATAGFRAFGETCAADLECGAGFCAGESGAGSCNLHCSSAIACPAGFSCGGDRCVPASATSTSKTNEDAGAGAAPGADGGGGCAIVSASASTSPAFAFIGGCLVIGARTLQRRRRRSQERSS